VKVNEASLKNESRNQDIEELKIKEYDGKEFEEQSEKGNQKQKRRKMISKIFEHPQGHLLKHLQDGF